MAILAILFDWFGGAIVSLPLAMVFMRFADRKRFSQKWIWVALFVLYMNAMLIIVGTPAFSYIVWDPTINYIPFSDFSVRNMIGMALNIVMFIPFGAFLPIYFTYFQKARRTVWAGFLMSLSIEVLQLFTFRATDVDDLMMNTVGALVGYGIAKLILRKRKHSEPEDQDIRKLVVMILVIVLIIAFVRYPLVALLFPFFNF